jgi:hypothetical protein
VRTACLALLAATTALAAPPAATSVTFNRDVLPILQKHCQSCHRPGEVAPMSFLGYQSARPWAKAMKAAVLAKKMPPWFADPQYGRFANEKRLTEPEISALVAWADNGSPEGDSKDKPPPLDFTPGWTIKPDVIVGMTKPFPIPAKGILELTHFIVPTGFTRDTWITSLEIRPSDPSVVHHVVVQFVTHKDDVKYGEPISTDKPREQFGDQINKIKKTDRGGFAGVGANLEGLYLPGGRGASDYRVFNAAKLIPAGTDIYIGMHYTPNGKATVDQTQVGFTLAKEPPKRRYISMLATPPQDEESFRIPAGDPNWKDGLELTFNQDAELVWFSPHMHQRGKDMTFRLMYPSGESETVLSVPRFNFEWQLGYEVAKPIRVPKGTRMEVVSHYDNSVNNPFNPNPNKDVWWGEQTWEEMMGAFFGLVIDSNVDPRRIAAYSLYKR